MYTVGQLARATGISVRALRHYDEIGLLRPDDRSDAGYRLYSHDDVERLQEILVWRALGFSLARIAALLDDPTHGRERALVRQRELVGAERERLDGIARALDAALAAHRQGTRMEVETMFQEFDPSEYEDEVQERWGETDAYRESTRRAAAYGEAEWSQIRAEASAVTADLAALMAAGEPADGEAAREVAGRWRAHITRWFYEATPGMARRLAAMWVEDPRFRDHYERVAEGLARYAHDAVVAEADAAQAQAQRS